MKTNSCKNTSAQKPESLNIRGNAVIFYITNNGLNLAQRLGGLYPEAQIVKFKTETVSNIWNACKNLVFIMATGIVVRTIAPLVKDKKTDPAVVVLDEKGRFAISLLSGHIGGANRLAKEIADFLGGEAVITTASDVNNTRQLYLRPKNLVIGIGCNSGTSANEIEDSVKNTLERNNLSFLSIHSIATIDKKGNEPGLIAFAKKYNLEINTFTPDQLNTVKGILKSEAAFKAIGVNAVAEPSAILVSGADRLLVPKQKIGNVTVAVAESVNELKSLGVKELKAPAIQRSNTPIKSQISNLQSPILYIVGTGPGGIEHITPYARDAIRKSDVIVGYITYLDLIKEIIKDKEIIFTGMTQEVDRCQKAVELVMSGKTVSVISGGDPGIYAMAGLVFEILKGHGSWVMGHEKSDTCPLPNIEVIPGVSALNACASRLGAPLMHDFASISLSDRLTPWDVIEKRLEASAMADFVIVLYNPKSMGRPEHISKARDIILKYRSPEIPVGIVKAAMRENETVVITDLKNMLNYDIDMQTTVIIGNSKTFIWDGWMVTSRGYTMKEGEKDGI